MLTRKQIEKLAMKNRVPLFTQERDYIQAAFLSLLYSKTLGFVFKGGTCLRMAYGSPRYSEEEEMIESIAKLEKTWTRTLSRCLGCLFHMMS